MYLNEELFIDFLSVKEILWTGINFAKAHFTQKGFNFTQEILHRERLIETMTVPL